VALLSIQLKDYDSARAVSQALLATPYRDKDGVRLYLGQVAEERKDLSDRPEVVRRRGRRRAIRAGADPLRPGAAKQGKLDAARARLQQAAAKSTDQRVQLILAEAQILRDATSQGGVRLVGQAARSRAEQSRSPLRLNAMLAEKIERVDILESALRKLIEIRPEHAHAYNALGYSLCPTANQRLPEAQDLIEKALKLAPDDSFIIDSMAGSVPQGSSRIRSPTSGARTLVGQTPRSPPTWAKCSRAPGRAVRSGSASGATPARQPRQTRRSPIRQAPESADRP